MANREHRPANNMNRILGRMPTTDTISSEEVAMMVVQHSRHHYDHMLVNQRLRLTQQVDVGTYVVLRFVVTLYSRTTEEIWTCGFSLRNHSENEVIVNNGEYRIVSEIYPQRSTVISTSKLDFGGHQLPPHACTFTLILPADSFPTSYNATFHLLKDGKNDFFGLCDEIYYNIQTNLQGLDLLTFQEGILSNVEYPVPRIKLKGILGCIDGWRIIMHFESLADNGEFRRYRRERQLLEAVARNRPHYKDLLAMVLLEEGVACLIQDRLREAVALAKRACRLSVRHNCVNDRAILGYAYAVYAAAARFAGDLTGAKRYLDSALEIFEPMEPSTYTAITLYNIGAIIMEKSAKVGVSDAEEKEAEGALRLAEQHWIHQTLNTTFRVLPRIYNRLISLYLKSSPNTAPDLTVNVSQQGLARADEKIRMVEAHLLPHFTNWLLTTFYLAKTDLCTRKGDTDGGLQAAKKSLQIATQFGLQRERQGANTRILMLQEIKTQGEPADML